MQHTGLWHVSPSSDVLSSLGTWWLPARAMVEVKGSRCVQPGQPFLSYQPRVFAADESWKSAERQCLLDRINLSTLHVAI